MAISSINFAKASSGGLSHNDRSEKEADYLLPPRFRGENEVDVSAALAKQKINDLYTSAKDNYAQEFGQKLQAKSYVWEAVINLNAEHKMEDLKRLVSVLENETGFKAVQIAIHRDEGHVRNSGRTAQKNLHAHVTFFTLDQKNGQQLFRRKLTDKQKKDFPKLEPMDRKRLSKIQTITAITMGMNRGKVGSKTVRLNQKAYRQVAQERRAERVIVRGSDEMFLQLLQEQKQQNAKLREKLQQQKAGRAAYAKLEAENKERVNEIKSAKQRHHRLVELVAKTEKTDELLSLRYQAQKKLGMKVTAIDKLPELEPKKKPEPANPDTTPKPKP